MRIEQPTAAGVPTISGGVPLTPTTRETAAIVGHLPPARRAIGATGLRVYPLAMSAKHFGSGVSEKTATRILDAYAALGGNVVDTADSYGEGVSELIVGGWLRRRRIRDDVVVATKIGRSTAHPGLSARAVTASVQGSLRRLGTDRIDLLYLHLDDPEVPFEETLLAVDELIRAGTVRTFGVSDHTGTRLLEARVACGMLGVAPLTTVQNEYNLLRRDFESELGPLAAQQGLAVMPRFPLAGGFLSGAVRTPAQLAATPAWSYLAPFLASGRRARRVLAALDRVARAQQTALATVALAWLLTKPGVVAPVVAASSADELFDLMSAPDLRLTRHQVAELDRASA